MRKLGVTVLAVLASGVLLLSGSYGASAELPFSPHGGVQRDVHAEIDEGVGGEAASASAAADVGWHQEAHDAQHTGASDIDVPQPWEMAWQWNGSCSDGSDCRPGDPELGWSFEVPPRSHLVAGGGRLYLPAGTHGVWAINESDGTTAWHNESVQSFCTAAFDPETDSLFVAAENGRLYRLDPADGTILDSFLAESGLHLAPTIADGKVYIVSDEGVLYAVDKQTMDVVWSYAAGSAGQTPAAYSAQHDLLVFGTADLYLHAVEDAGGARRWRVKPTVHNSPIYYYTNGWPVIADQHGVVLMRLRLERSDAFTVPEGWATYPDTNDAIRSFLTANPNLQTLFALNLSDGSTAFVPAIGSGGMERPDKDHSMGPQPVVRQYPDGEEVVYTIWRNRLNGIGYFWENPSKNYDGGMCEMVLDDTSVPGYEAGDCRFVEFNTPMTVDEMCFVSMTGPTILYSHWISLQSYRITDRSDTRGNSYENAIQAERQPTVVNRINGSAGCSQDTDTHFCNSGLETYCDGKYYGGGGFWVFWDTTDPPYECASAYSDGMKPRYAISNNGRIYYELNGGTIFAIRSTAEPQADVGIRVEPGSADSGESVSYTIRILGNGQPLDMNDPLPEEMMIPRSIQESSGSAVYDSEEHTIRWSGAPQLGSWVEITFLTTVGESSGYGVVDNTAYLMDETGVVASDTARLIVNPQRVYLPLVRRAE